MELISSTTVFGVKSSYASPPSRCVYVVVVVDLDHGGVCAGAEAFHAQQREHAVGGGLAVLDAELLHHGLPDLLSTAQHARSGDAGLDEELSHLLPTPLDCPHHVLRSVHGIECGHFVHLGGGHLKDFSHLVHGSKGQVVAGLRSTPVRGTYDLSLGKIKERHHRRLLIVLGVSLHNLVHSSIIIGREIEGGIDIVLGAVVVLEDEPFAPPPPYLHSLTEVQETRSGLHALHQNTNFLPQERILKRSQHGKEQRRERGTFQSIIVEIEARRNTL